MVRVGAMVLVAGVFVLLAGTDVASAAEVSVDNGKLDRIREYVESQRVIAGLPGISVGVVLDEQVVLAEGFGEAVVGSEPMTPHHVTVVASLSKSITAMAVMVLVDDGLVDIDDPVTAYLPELAPTGDSVTIRQVMHHRSGLTERVGNDPFVGNIGATLDANVSRLNVDFVAGSGFEYSNANYDSLALLVERVSGMPYPEFVSSRIFATAEMKASVAGSVGATSDRLATGYYHRLLLGYQPHTPWMQDGMVGSYTTFSNVEDLTKYAMIHINRGAYRGRQIVSPSSLAVLHEPNQYGPGNFPVGYGGGFRIFPGGEFETASNSDKFTQLVHDGSSPSYRSFLIIAPEAGTGVVVLANANDFAFESAVPQIAYGVVDLLYDGTARVVTKPNGLDRWDKHLLLLLVITQLGLAAASIPTLRRARHTGTVRTSGWIILGLSVAFNLVALYLLTVFIPESSNTRLAVSYSLPDYRILFTLMGAGIFWGIAQIGLIANWKLSRTTPTPNPV